MIHLIAYSGGLSSFLTAHMVVQQHRPESVRCVFTDTMTEDEDLYRFLAETLTFLGCDYVHLADGRNIWEVFNDVKFMGNNRIDPCSALLKREVFRQYLEDKDPTEHIIYYGIGAHEAHRMKTIADRWAPFSVEAPLIATGWTPDQIQNQAVTVLESANIDPPRLYELGFEHNNCGGFCIKTGQRQMSNLLLVLPDRYRWHEEEQEKLFAKIGPHGFIRKTTRGQMAYLSLKQFRESLEQGEKPQMFQDGSCGCFT